MRRSLSVASVALAALTLSSPLRAQAPEKPVRFRDPAGITGDPTGLHLIPPIGIRIRFPDRALRADEPGFPVVAFVVDTTGRIEMPTVSFLDESPRDFQKSVCDYLPKLRFEPFLVAGQKMRVLAVQTYGFNSLWNPDSTGMAKSDALAREKQEAYGTQPFENVVPELERRPHCDDPKGK